MRHRHSAPYGGGRRPTIDSPQNCAGAHDWNERSALRSSFSQHSTYGRQLQIDVPERRGAQLRSSKTAASFRGGSLTPQPSLRSRSILTCNLVYTTPQRAAKFRRFGRRAPSSTRYVTWPATKTRRAGRVERPPIAPICFLGGAPPSCLRSTPTTTIRRRITTALAHKRCRFRP